MWKIWSGIWSRIKEHPILTALTFIGIIGGGVFLAKGMIIAGTVTLGGVVAGGGVVIFKGTPPQRTLVQKKDEEASKKLENETKERKERENTARQFRIKASQSGITSTGLRHRKVPSSSTAEIKHTLRENGGPADAASLEQLQKDEQRRAAVEEFQQADMPGKEKIDAIHSQFKCSR